MNRKITRALGAKPTTTAIAIRPKASKTTITNTACKRLTTFCSHGIQ